MDLQESRTAAARVHLAAAEVASRLLVSLDTIALAREVLGSFVTKFLDKFHAYLDMDGICTHVYPLDKI